MILSAFPAWTASGLMITPIGGGERVRTTWVIPACFPIVRSMSVINLDEIGDLNEDT